MDLAKRIESLRATDKLTTTRDFFAFAEEATRGNIYLTPIAARLLFADTTTPAKPFFEHVFHRK